jgi:hypothetical protein
MEFRVKNNVMGITDVDYRHWTQDHASVHFASQTEVWSSLTILRILTDLVQSYGCDKWKRHDWRRQFVVMDSWTFLRGPVYSFLYWKIHDVRVICRDEVVGGVSFTCSASLCASSYVYRYFSVALTFIWICSIRLYLSSVHNIWRWL